MKSCWPALALIMCGSASGTPLHDAIPKEFQGTFATDLKDCADPNGVELITINSSGVNYYEGNDYLLLGIEFSGSSTKSEKYVPLFNVRFIGRMETKILGEVDARMEMETPDILIRYRLKEDGEPNPKPANIWRRCPAKL